MNESHHRLALPQGTRIQDFEFHRVLGQGGFGITYLGWNMALDIPVAIKEYLPSDLATRESDMSVVPQSSQAASDFAWGLDRFLDEARTLARFDHRHIIKVHHFFQAHGTAYIVMEYAEGDTLSKFLQSRGTLSEAELKAILYPILDGLEEVHGADFLHRDIKPGNIIIRDADHSPVLLDFGAARQAISTKSRSITSIITPGYAPIEQYSSRGDQGPWTDIYALGAVCYHALTGQVPEDATERVVQDALMPVVEQCAGQARVEFLSAIDRSLQVHKANRPQNIAEWRAALGEETGSGPRKPPTTPPSKKQDREEVAVPSVHQRTDDRSESPKKPKGKLIAAIACLLAVLIGGVSYYQSDLEKRLSAAEETEWRPTSAQTCAGQPEGTECWKELANHAQCYVWNNYLYEDQTVTWTGECSGSLAHGQGKLTWVRGNDENVFTGHLLDGKRHGDWVLRFADGGVQKGPYVDGEKNGDWVLRFASGNVSEGPYVDSKRHGDWVWRFADGNVEEGPYVDDKRHGDWVLRLADGGVQKGPYVDGEKNGDWVLRFADGNVEEGPYVDSKRHGDWVLRFADGNVEEGPYVDDKRHGDWVLRLADGGVQKGPYVDGEKNGDWVLRFASGNVSEGPYVDSKRHGDWVLRLADGGVQKGPYVDGEKNGDWVLRFASGNVSEGPYVDSKRHGDWVLRFADGQVEEGPYVDGEKNGRWTIRFADGRVSYTIYANGKVVSKAGAR